MWRISAIAQVVAFPMAIITPLVCVFIGIIDLDLIIKLTAYPWVVGITAAVWNRLIEERL